ncbi:ParB/RepB/Spo0J family partition protein [Oribacterium sinus]|uniref:ParB/RepB/Spo0J family partition protein n=1 Tax=Oribacterium sinus TaxID=237576 RepID=UPI0028E5BE81|nr:ParB/RepB/Spo0J family partition protein [Oribacterium sinus]
MAKHGLGRGVDTLFAGKKDGREKKEEQAMVKLSLIQANPKQPRKQFSQEELEELSQSIKQFGVLQPLLVKKEGPLYEIIAGERRFRAAKMAGLTEIPVLIRDYDEKLSKEVAIIENIQREDLNAVEEAMAYQSLLTEYHLSQEELAERVAKKRSTIANSLRLLKLEEEILEYLRQNLLSEGHARALLSVENTEKRLSLAKECVEKKWSVREMERRAKEEKAPMEKQDKPKKLSSQWKTIVHGLEEKMKEHLGTKVTITAKNEDKGKVEIEYYSKEDLDRITRILEGRGEE